jgi:hypothetical protein
MQSKIIGGNEENLGISRAPEISPSARWAKQPGGREALELPWNERWASGVLFQGRVGDVQEHLTRLEGALSPLICCPAPLHRIVSAPSP